MQGKGYVLAISAIVAIITIYYRENIFTRISLIFCWLILINYKRFILLPILTLIIFGTYFYYVEVNNNTVFSGSETKFSGEIITSPVLKNEKMTFTFNDDKDEKLIVQLKDKKDVSIGNRCVLAGSLEKPLKAKNFYDFNYASYLYFQRIHWILYVEEIECTKQSLTVLQKVKRYRNEGIKKVLENYPKDISGYVNALIFGERSTIPKEEYELYQQQGLSHLLAISGLHVGTLLGSIYFLFIRVGLTREKTMSVILLVLPLYVIVAGSAPSVVRASSMAFLFLLFIRLRKKMLAIDAISIGCIFILINDPYKLFHLGFQLSFTVSFFLICSTTIISRYQLRSVQLLVVTFIAQVASFPFILFTNYEISLWSYPLNLIFIPVYSLVILPLTFLSFLTIEIPTIFNVLTTVTDFIFQALLQILKEVHNLSFGNIIFGKPSILLVLAYYVTLLIGFYRWELNIGFKKFMQAFALFFLLCFAHFLFPYVDGKIEVTFLDVGQGDSIVIKLPYHREVIVIDAGKAIVNNEGEVTFDAGKDVVIPYLKANGIKNIDKLILTHGDIDHIGGAAAIIKDFPVNQLLLSKTKLDDKISQLSKIAFKKRIRVINARRGMKWNISDSHFFILHPSKENYYNERNNQSVVIFSELGNKKWLFTGDIEKEVEEELVTIYKNLDVDVLKVAHHGSKTSSTQDFLNETSPNVAVISVGRNNIYGHPHNDVLQRLRNSSIVIARTDLDGAISFIYRRDKWHIVKSLK